MRKHHVRFGGGLLEKCRRKTVTRQEPTLRLYDKEIARTAGLENGSSNSHGSNGNGQSEKSTGQTTSPNPPAPPNPQASQAETLQYRDGVAVDTSNAVEVEAFNAFKSAHQGLAPDSREVLRSWTSSHNGKK